MLVPLSVLIGTSSSTMRDTHEDCLHEGLKVVRLLSGTITLFAPCAVTLPTEDSILGVLRQGTDVVTASEVETRETVLGACTIRY